MNSEIFVSYSFNCDQGGGGGGSSSDDDDDK